MKTVRERCIGTQHFPEDTNTCDTDKDDPESNYVIYPKHLLRNNLQNVDETKI